ncbi:cyclase family protein [Labrenzia sp. DG1229]|uniref:cyclase family protein n=1 Tax=Labrenzia sp. DG1229 TaxID=681847 RepID=UPI00048B6C1E|nr:cyclase family protein [Labrenzia sp. DG1229]
MCGDIPKSISAMLEGAPTVWGHWGDDDELGALNYLSPNDVMAAAQIVRQGKTFTLQAPMGSPEGDYIFPTRDQPKREMVRDKRDYESGGEKLPGDFKFAEDTLHTFLHGTTHMDALGHAWCGRELYNGYSDDNTIEEMSRASALPLAQRGVVARGVLLDVARWRGRDLLESGEVVTIDDVLACAKDQKVELRPRDTLLLRTGRLGAYTGDATIFDNLIEPGLVYSPELVDWFLNTKITGLVTDTICNEVAIDPATGALCTLHIALQRNLGVPFVECAALDALAADCTSDGQYDFMYVAGPMKIVGSTAAPVNPVAIK